MSQMTAHHSQPVSPSSPQGRGGAAPHKGGGALTPLVGFPIAAAKASKGRGSAKLGGGGSSASPRKSSPAGGSPGTCSSQPATPSPPDSPCSLLLDSSSDSDSGSYAS